MNVGDLGRKLAISWKSKLPSRAATSASYFQKTALTLLLSIMQSAIQNKNKDGFVGQMSMLIDVDNIFVFLPFLLFHLIFIKTVRSLSTLLSFIKT